MTGSVDRYEDFDYFECGRDRSVPESDGRRPNGWGARLPLRWPKGESGKILMFSISIASA